MRARSQLGGLFCVMLAACTDGNVAPAPELTPREVLAQVLQLQLPPTAGREPLADGITVWVTPTEVAVTLPDHSLVRHIEPRPLVDRDTVLGPLYDAVASELPPVITRPEDVPDEPKLPAPIDLMVDARVTMPTLVAVLSTLSRAGAHEFRLAGGTAAQPGGVTIEPSPFCALHPEPPAHVPDIRIDLALRWSADGPRATALPRPSDRAPFAVGFYPDPFDDAPEPGFPDEVPLRLATDGDPPLDIEAVQRLVAAVCAFNRGPFGVELSPPETMTQRELLAVLVAADPGRECSGPRVLTGLGLSERTGTPVPLDALREHVLALANAKHPPDHKPTPP